MITEVRGDGIFVKIPPFMSSFEELPFEEIKSCKVEQYSPLVDYGGYGIRYGRKGKAFNARGRKGVLLDLADKGSVLIGSQKPDALKAAIDSALS